MKRMTFVCIDNVSILEKIYKSIIIIEVKTVIDKIDKSRCNLC